MNKCFLLLPLIFLAACLPVKKDQSGDEFYTWVDASGQIRTTQKPKEEKIKPTKSASETARKKPSTKSKGTFNSRGYRSAGDVDKELGNKKLFSWRENDLVINQEANLKEITPPKPDHLVIIKPPLNINQTNYDVLLDQAIYKWDSVKGRELNLSRAYTFNESLKKDSMLIEIPAELSRVIFKSYIKKSKIALPQVLFLGKYYEALSNPVTPFSHSIAESWGGYAHMQGVVSVPLGSQYMLVTTNPVSTIIELDEVDIKVGDLGFIMFNSHNKPL